MNRVLFQPFRLHDLTLSNRIVMSPMTRARAGAARLPNRVIAEYYAQRSSAGLVITEMCNVERVGRAFRLRQLLRTSEKLDIARFDEFQGRLPVNSIDGGSKVLA